MSLSGCPVGSTSKTGTANKYASVLGRIRAGPAGSRDDVQRTQHHGWPLTGAGGHCAVMGFPFPAVFLSSLWRHEYPTWRCCELGSG